MVWPASFWEIFYWSDVFGPGLVFYIVGGILLFVWLYIRFAKDENETSQGARNKAIIITLGVLFLTFLGVLLLRPIFGFFSNLPEHHDHTGMKKALEAIAENNG